MVIKTFLINVVLDQSFVFFLLETVTEGFNFSLRVQIYVEEIMPEITDLCRGDQG